MLSLPPVARLALPLVAVVAVSALAGLPPGATAAGDGPDDDRERLARVAEVNGLDIAQVQELLSDPDVRLLDNGRAYYVDPGAADRAAPSEAEAVAPLRRTFRLHSKPRSRRTIVLDFDGTMVRGTAWNRQVGVRSGRHSGWDPANNGPSFTDREKRTVQSIWARVAEDYAPFDVDVTTQEPTDARIHRTRRSDKVFGTRVLISESGNAHSRICSRQCGGVSFLNVFDAVGGAHRRHQPSWVFPAGLRNDLKAVAEAATHEAGHTFGLVHDNQRSLLGATYYTGHGSWAPIMGAAYERPISQWSKGSYEDATSNQDDVAVIAHRGAPFRRDEAGGTWRSAARGLPGGPAYISRRGDVDIYRLGQCSGRLSIRLQVAKTSPNLDAGIALLRNGRAIASADPPSRKLSRDRATGMSASLTRTVSRGIFAVAVDGVARGNPVTSYNDYGSLGAYRLKVRGC